MLSITTVNYNNCAGLRRTAESILNQTSEDYEWIVIDGGSTDGSAELLSSYKDRVTYWVSEPDRGIYHAMNKGIDVAKGEYLLFLNSGDMLHDSEVISDFTSRDSKEDVVYGREVGVDTDGTVMWEWQFPPRPLRLSFFWTRTLKHQATFFHRRCFDRFRYNESHKINSDVELFMSLLYHGYTFGEFDRLVAKFDIGGISGSAEYAALARREFRDTLSRLMPTGMVADYDDLIFCQDVDIVRKAVQLAKSPKWIRTLTRIFLYPLSLLATRR